ncbi:MAG: ISAs1 family transposase [Inquilinus sp.]|uniref:ISAs1 family transposase n=1 Tax=Inquilinus sp. TaxID=1932117 RepID=UPI003F2D1C0E
MQTVISIFREVRDPRDMNARHDVGAMLFVSLAATLCGAKSCVDIADFTEANLEGLREIVDLSHGAPSHDSFSRLFRLLDPVELELALRRFGAALREGLGLGAAKGVVAIDGKSLRHGYERGSAYMPPLLISVWDAQTRLSIAAHRAPGGNEVSGVLEVLKTLVLKGCIVTADALHCHPKMAEAVRATGGHYAITLKANHAPLHTAAEAAFARAAVGGRLAFVESRESGHDRHEWRRVSVIPRPAGAPDFPGLVALGRIEAERRLSNGKVETGRRYVVLSKRLSPARLAETVRTHWSVENGLHWQLDVTFHEDDARSRKGYAPQNLAVIRRMALDILRSHPSDKSIARKMKLAAWKQSFFFELFTYMR